MNQQAKNAGASVPAVQEKAATIVEYFSSNDTKKAIKAALPKHLSADRYLRIVLTAFNKTPKLQRCSIASLWSSVLWLSQKGLEPDGYKAHLIPYGEECKVVIDYKGLVDLARRSKEVGDIHADVVREGDYFEFQFGTDPKLIHRPKTGNTGKITHGYTCVWLKGFDRPSFEVMDYESIVKIRDRSEGYKAYKAKKISTSPWITDEAEMCKKTVFRRHAKWLPVSEDFIDAVRQDFDSQDFDVDVPTKGADLMPEPIAEIPSSIAGDFISEVLVKQMTDMMRQFGIKDETFLAYLKETFKVETPQEVVNRDYPAVIDWMMKNKAKK